MSSSSSFSSFLSDLPPQDVESTPIKLKAKGVGIPNYKKPLMEKEPSTSPMIHQGDSSNPPSLISISYLHFDGNPTPLPEGVGGFQGIDPTFQLGVSPLLNFR
ncbi:hypothetical protein TSUD_368260 [Trifolium subterraneum]|uniref:Uncharacterized protein n=1 Tax=Trifolium subterraneum TaxID=3900 RepID=A0A2Z6LMB6_TRISU|nr:hypothetical protein TSUD_368260 [Trifolium subterraneum]